MKIVRHEIIVALIVVIIDLVLSDIVSRDLGKSFHGCLYKAAKFSSIRGVVGTKLQFYCHSIEMFKTSAERDFPGKRLTESEFDWCLSLIDQGKNKNRFKRQAERGRKGRKPRRQEYRTLSDRQRAKYHAAIHALKTNMIGNSSHYDILAKLHTGMTTVTAHGGCAFLPWHRQYLNMYEAALQLVDPSVSLPYWDSTLDGRMPREEQVNSVLWHDDFMGTPRGTVTSGVAAGWSTGRFGPLTRNVGLAAGAALISDEEIKNVIERTRMSEICGDNSRLENDLEFIHGPPHIYVDGQMGNIESASWDPLFWMHHCFIDLVWELFRKNSENRNVNIETDYPTEGFGDMFHAGHRTMGFGNVTAKDGLRKKHMRNTYAPRPTCTGRGTCGPKYLKCVNINGTAKCIPKTIQEVEDDRANPPTTLAPTTTTPRPTTTTPGPTTTTPGPVECPKPYPKPDTNPGPKPVQNTFCADGKSDSSEWVYLPIQIMTSRPPDYHGYNSYRVSNGRAVTKSDVYNPSSYSEFRKYIKPGRPKTFDQCNIDKLTAGQIFIQSDGLNYDGNWKDYAIVDNRLAISLSIIYVAIKDPEKILHGATDKKYRYSDVLLSAYDSCGRMCRANCLVPGKKPPVYRPCSGALRVTPNALNKNMYGRDYGGASMNIWDFKDRRCPQFEKEQIFVSFYCDYSDRWPWPSSLSKPPPIDGPELPPAPQKPKLKECAVPLPWDRFGTCVIKRMDCSATCASTKIFKCIGTCDEYAWCSGSNIGVTMCRYGQEFYNLSARPKCVASTRESCPGAFHFRKRQLARLALRGRGRGRGRRRGRGLG